jgi:hypothetical protein
MPPGSCRLVAVDATCLGDEAMWESHDVLAVRKAYIFVQVQPQVVHDPARIAG